eukprot:351219_1
MTNEVINKNKDFNCLLIDGLSCIQEENANSEWISNQKLRQLVIDTSTVVKCGADVIVEGTIGCGGQIMLQDSSWKEFGRSPFPTGNHSASCGPPGATKTGPMTFNEKAVKSGFKKTRLWLLQSNLLTDKDLVESDKKYKQYVKSKTKNTKKMDDIKLDESKGNESDDDSKSKRERLIERELNELKEETKEMPSLNVERIKFVFGALVRTSSGGFLIHAQNKRQVFEEIALHFGGHVLLAYSEISEFNEVFGRGANSAATLLQVLGDQTAPPRNHTSSYYSVGGIKILRCSVSLTGVVPDDLRWLLSTTGKGAVERTNVLVVSPFIEHPRTQCRTVSGKTENQLIDIWSDIFSLLSIVTMTKSTSDFKQFRDTGFVMRFTASLLNGPEGENIQKLNLDEKYPGYKLITYKDKQIPELPPDKIQAVDIWALSKIMQTSNVCDDLEYTVSGIDPKIIMSEFLYGLNDREARRMNNKALVFTLLYHILEGGWFELREQCGNFLEAVEKFAPIIANIEEKLLLFRADAYYDVFLFHQYMKKSIIIYKDTCRSNGIKITNTDSLHGSQSATALKKTKNPLNVDDATLIQSCMLSYDTAIGEKHEMNSSSLRICLKQISQTIKAPSIQTEFTTLKDLNIVKEHKLKGRKWSWEFLPFEPNKDSEEVLSLLKKVLIDTNYSSVRNYKNLENHHPSLQDYWENVVKDNDNTMLEKMKFERFEKFIMGTMSWESCVNDS